MATNHTTNYALNLWEPTDAFVREEFNQDNAKIDEALQAQRFGRFEVLHSVTIPAGTAGVTSVDFDMTDIHPEDWYFWMLGCSGDSGSSMFLRANGSNQGKAYDLTHGSKLGIISSEGYVEGGSCYVHGGGPSLILIPTCRTKRTSFPAISYNGRIFSGWIDTGSSALNMLSLVPNGGTLDFYQDTTFFLLGVR